MFNKTSAESPERKQRVPDLIVQARSQGTDRHTRLERRTWCLILLVQLIGMYDLGPPGT